MVKGHYLGLRWHLLLFHNFKQSNIKAATAHHPIIKNEIDELLSKGAIEPSTVGTGFYLNVFMVPKGTGS